MSLLEKEYITPFLVLVFIGIFIQVMTREKAVTDSIMEFGFQQKSGRAYSALERF